MYHQYVSIMLTLPLVVFHMHTVIVGNGNRPEGLSILNPHHQCWNTPQQLSYQMQLVGGWYTILH